MEFTRDTVVAIAPDVVSRSIAGEVLILNLASGTYLGLDPVGSRIWELIPEKHTFGNILEVIVAEYDVQSARAQVDLARLVSEMLDQGLVRIASSG